MRNPSKLSALIQKNADIEVVSGDLVKGEGLREPFMVFTLLTISSTLWVERVSSKILNLPRWINVLQKTLLLQQMLKD